MTQARQSESIRQQQSLVRGAGENHKHPNTHVGWSTEKGGAQLRLHRDLISLKLEPQLSLPVADVENHLPTKDSSVQLGMLYATSVPHVVTSRKCVDRLKWELHGNKLTTTTGPAKSESFMGSLTGGGSDPRRSPWEVTVSLNDNPTKFESDTGAEVSVISRKAHQEVGSPTLSPPKKILHGPGNHKLAVKGQFTAKLKLGDREVEQELFVIRNLHKNLLGRPAIEALDLVVRVGAVQERPVVRYPSLFEGLDGEYSIRHEEGAKPFALMVPHWVAIPLLQPVKEELSRMEKLGVIC